MSSATPQPGAQVIRARTLADLHGGCGSVWPVRWQPGSGGDELASLYVEFEATGQFRLKIGAEQRPANEIWRSSFATAYLILSPRVPDPLLVYGRGARRNVSRVARRDVRRSHEGSIFLAEDFEPKSIAVALKEDNPGR